MTPSESARDGAERVILAIAEYEDGLFRQLGRVHPGSVQEDASIRFMRESIASEIERQVSAAVAEEREADARIADACADEDESKARFYKRERHLRGVCHRRAWDRRNHPLSPVRRVR